jgi:hypothetical protein
MDKSGIRRLLRAGNAGFTLLEITIAAAVSVVLVVGVFGMVKVGRKNTTFVKDETITNRKIRGSGNRLAQELRQSSPQRVTMIRDSSGNLHLKLQLPITLQSGAIVWGVRDDSLGTTEQTKVRPGWSIVYSAVPVFIKGVNRVDLQLQRLVRDANDNVQHRKTILRWLEKGTAGFDVALSGNMYHVAVSARADQRTGEGPYRNMGFDVAIRN